MQTMNQYILPSPALSAAYPAENGDTSPTSPATNRSYSWSTGMVSFVKEKSPHNPESPRFSSFLHC